MRIGRLIARAIIGATFVGHGTQKWFGWFGGPGLEGAAGMMDSLGLKPPKRHATLASVTETVGGAMLVLGALTPVAATGLIATMITAIRTVHLPNGFWSSNGGYELNLALIAALVGLVDGGPGDLSVDEILGLDETGGASALTALAVGAAGSTVVMELARRRTQSDQQAATPEAGQVPQEAPRRSQEAAQVTGTPAPASG